MRGERRMERVVEGKEKGVEPIDAAKTEIRHRVLRALRARTRARTALCLQGCQRDARLLTKLL